MKKILKTRRIRFSSIAEIFLISIGVIVYVTGVTLILFSLVLSIVWLTFFKGVDVVLLCTIIGAILLTGLKWIVGKPNTPTNVQNALKILYKS